METTALTTRGRPEAEALEALCRKASISWRDGQLRLTSATVPTTLEPIAQALATSLRSASDAEIVALLTKLRLRGCKMQNAFADLDWREILAAYVEELRQCPADLLRKTVNGWRDEWWPAAGVLRDKIERAAQETRALSAAVSAWDRNAAIRAAVAEHAKTLAWLKAGNTNFDLRHLEYASRDAREAGIGAEIVRIEGLIADLERQAA